MCLSCGCGAPNTRHKPGDITMDDVQKAATNHNMTPKQVAENIQKGTK
jgi:hypothetical protein